MYQVCSCACTKSWVKKQNKAYQWFFFLLAANCQRKIVNLHGFALSVLKNFIVIVFSRAGSEERSDLSGHCDVCAFVHVCLFGCLWPPTKFFLFLHLTLHLFISQSISSSTYLNQGYTQSDGARRFAGEHSFCTLGTLNLILVRINFWVYLFLNRNPIPMYGDVEGT